ncbi:MAG TPA: hypothetical protein VFE05_04835 [Longimicrobiaceae bacterium]|jgi:hypothetical protein|nr:hypothetical protein [Longimicrobiaceae bacterium]
MKMIHRMLLGLALAAAPLPLAAQGGAGPDVDAADPRPFALLHEHAAELNLSAAQVSRLEAIARRLEAQNGPLREQLRRQMADFRQERRAAFQRLTPEQRRDTLARLRDERLQGHRADVPEPMRPTVGQMRRNLQAAMQEAQGVLTPQQKARARQLIRARGPGGGRPGAGGPGRRRRPGAPGRP